MPRSSIGHCIRDERRKRHISQKDLARRAGLSFSTINRLENRRMDASEKHIIAIAKALNVPQNALVPGRRKNKKKLDRKPPLAGLGVGDDVADETF